MDDQLKELVSRADRGDAAAQKELMERGDQASSAGEHEQAAYLYKMAAIAYRIAGGRTSGILADTAHTCAWFAKTLGYYDEWVKKYTVPVAPRINRLKEHKGNFDQPIGAMWREKDAYKTMLHYLQKKLMEHDIEICTGATINKHFYYMVNQREPFTEFMNDINVRVVLDPICDEVARLMEIEKNGMAD